MGLNDILNVSLNDISFTVTLMDIFSALVIYYGFRFIIRIVRIVGGIPDPDEVYDDMLIKINKAIRDFDIKLDDFDSRLEEISNQIESNEKEIIMKELEETFRNKGKLKKVMKIYRNLEKEEDEDDLL